MSRLDNLYTFYRRYCKEIANRRNGAILTELIILEDGSGSIETKIYLPDDSNPFRITTEQIITFLSPGDGARKLEALVNEQKIISEGDGQTNKGYMGKDNPAG